jgi:hypothetical protein
VKIKSLSLTLILLTLLATIYITGCASVYYFSRAVDKKDISSLSDYTAYINEGKDLILIDKSGGLELKLNSEWKKISQSESNLSKYVSDPRFKAKEIVTHNRETKTTNQEAILFFPERGDEYNLDAYDNQIKIEKKAEGASGGGGGGGGCFTPETPVLMSDGKIKPIKQIQIGDEVKSFDFHTNKTTSNRVIALFKFKKTEYLIINGLEVTKTHPFCIGKGIWKEAGMLIVGDVVIGEGNSEIKIETIKKVQKDITVHNFTVDGTQNYFVSNGEKNFLVHNKGGGSM